MARRARRGAVGAAACPGNRERVSVRTARLPSARGTAAIRMRVRAAPGDLCQVVDEQLAARHVSAGDVKQMFVMGEEDDLRPVGQVG